ncbi:MAG: alpha/beta hydrolase [Planctomycetota bacterium]
MHGRVETHAFSSRLLTGNPLGDSAVRRVPVYLPPGTDGKASFPVLYALAGFTGTGRTFLNHDWYEPNLPERIDALIVAGKMPPVVVVMVDGMTAVGGNQYVDSTAVGPWASHVVEELVPWAEEAFPVRPGRSHRGVFGKSSGGYGSLMMGLEHADTFSAVASHSGDCYFEYCYGVDFPKAADGLRSVGGVEAFLAKLRAREWPKFPSHLFPALNLVAMAHFYSPDPAHPLGFRLPFDEATGERRPDVLSQWATRDPVELVATHAEALRRLSLLFFDCGTKDQFNLHHGARILAARLSALGVEHVHEEFEDDHRGLGYRYEASLPRLARAIS